MGIPKRNDERIASLPIEPFLTNKSRPTAPKRVVDNCAGVPVRFGFLPWAEKTQSALDRRHGGTLCHWVPILKEVAVKAVGSSRFDHRRQTPIRVRPLVVKK